MQLLWYGKQLLQAALSCLPYGIQLLKNPLLQSIKPAYPKPLTSLMMAQENGVYPMKRSRETKGVTSQITPTAKARALLRITFSNAAVVYGYAVNTLENRLKAKVCELCGTTESDHYEVHHINKLKNLKGKERWEIAMIAKHRKTLVVCRDLPPQYYPQKVSFV